MTLQVDNGDFSLIFKHKIVPQQFEIEKPDGLIVVCRISSNCYLFTILIRELNESPRFRDIFYNFLKCLRFRHSTPFRSKIEPVFCSLIYSTNEFRLKADRRLKIYDESINRRWASIQIRSLAKRIRYEASWAWLSTLGGGHSCLGEVSLQHALEAETMSKSQFRLATEIGDPNAQVKSMLFLALSYLQQKRFDEVRIILRTQHVRIKQKDITEDRLPVMCAALWKRFQYTLRPPSA